MKPTPDNVLERLLDGSSAGPASGTSEDLFPSVVIVAAHPDDEVIGAGAQLSKWRKLHVVHVTDGTPRDGQDMRAAGFSSSEGYAAARRREAQLALGLAAVPSSQIRCLGFVDQETCSHLSGLIESVEQLLEELQPDAVLTHPYEGGHPDHDATAFAVHAACRSLEQGERCQPALLEMTSYHNRAGIMETSEFLPRPDCEGRRIVLSSAEREFKRRLFDCFGTQQKVLQWFPIRVEAFRVAPRYDFTQPPHEGTLHYEQFPWGMTGARWCHLVQAAQQNLRFVACH